MTLPPPPYQPGTPAHVGAPAQPGPTSQAGPPSHPAARPSRPPRWWRANRIWLAAIPFALALAILTSSFAFRTVHSDDQLPEEHVAVAGKLDLSTTILEVPVEISMELTSQVVGAESNGYQAPTSAVVWTVQVSFAADLPSDVYIGACTVGLVDSDQRRYSPGKGLLGPGPSSYQSLDCAGDDPAATTWTKTWTFGVPDSVSIASLQLWWDPPRVAVFPLSPP